MSEPDVVSIAKLTQQLEQILETMDLPYERKARFTEVNLKWLKRNLGRKNLLHPQYREAINIIFILM
jgi:hypothetical protein